MDESHSPACPLFNFGNRGRAGVITLSEQEIINAGTSGHTIRETLPKIFVI